jgi:hypothetical protein
VRAALAAYKERFVRSLPAAQRGHVDFGRPVFLAAAFFLVARKNRVAVRREEAQSLSNAGGQCGTTGCAVGPAPPCPGWPCGSLHASKRAVLNDPHTPTQPHPHPTWTA